MRMKTLSIAMLIIAVLLLIVGMALKSDEAFLYGMVIILVGCFFDIVNNIGELFDGSIW